MPVPHKQNKILCALNGRSPLWSMQGNTFPCSILITWTKSKRPAGPTFAKYEAVSVSERLLVLLRVVRSGATVASMHQTAFVIVPASSIRQASCYFAASLVLRAFPSVCMHSKWCVPRTHVLLAPRKVDQIDLPIWVG